MSPVPSSSLSEAITVFPADDKDEAVPPWAVDRIEPSVKLIEFGIYRSPLEVTLRIDAPLSIFSKS